MKKKLKIKPNNTYYYDGFIDNLESIEYPYSLKRFDKQFNIEILDKETITFPTFSYDAKTSRFNKFVYVYFKNNGKLMCHKICKKDLKNYDI